MSVRDYSKGQYVTILSQSQLRQIISAPKIPYDAKIAVKEARKNLRKQGLKI